MCLYLILRETPRGGQAAMVQTGSGAGRSSCRVRRALVSPESTNSSFEAHGLKKAVSLALAFMGSKLGIIILPKAK